MRNFREPTCKNLLRRSKVLGVNGFALMSMFLAVGLFQLMNMWMPIPYAQIVGTVFLLSGYLCLRLIAIFGSLGCEEQGIFKIEKLFARAFAGKKPSQFINHTNRVEFQLKIQSPDTLSCEDLVLEKANLVYGLSELEHKEEIRVRMHKGVRGWRTLTNAPVSVSDITDCEVWSLVNLPAHTDPVWILSVLKNCTPGSQVIIRIKGLSSDRMQKRLEGARKRSVRTSATDAFEKDVTKAESEKVLEGILRGEDAVCEMALVIIAPKSVALTLQHFIKEKNKELTLKSITGERKRFFRSHIFI